MPINGFVRTVRATYAIGCVQRRDRSGVELVDLSGFSDVELVDSRSTSRVLSSDVSFVTFGTASKIGLLLNFFKGYI